MAKDITTKEKILIEHIKNDYWSINIERDDGTSLSTGAQGAMYVVLAVLFDGLETKINDMCDWDAYQRIEDSQREVIDVLILSKIEEALKLAGLTRREYYPYRKGWDKKNNESDLHK